MLRWLLTLGGCFAGLAPFSVSAAPVPLDGSACAALYESAQKLKLQGALLEAREALRSCASLTCPRLIREDCTQWIADVEEALPTVVLIARDDRGTDLSQVQVTLDGAPFVSSLSGRAQAVNPGEHTFRFASAGREPVEQRVTISQGEKQRPLRVTFASPVPVFVARETPLPPTPVSRSSRLSPPVLLWGGGAVLGLGGFTFFGLQGRSDYRALERSCAPDCTASQVRQVKTSLLLADGALLAGLVSLGVATYLFVADSP